MKLTAEMIHAAKSSNGGWSAEQLRALGFKGFEQGWIKSAIGMNVSQEQYGRFLALRNAHIHSDAFSDRKQHSAKPASTHCYLVFRGRTVGLFERWGDVLPSIQYYREASYRRYDDAEQAFADWERFENTGKPPKRPKQAATVNLIPEKNRERASLQKRVMDVLKARGQEAVATGGPIGELTFSCQQLPCKYPLCACR